MPIHKPGRRLLHAVPLKFVQDKAAGHGGRSSNAGLSLTSMIDFLIVVVVFLLMSFNTSGEMPLAKNITLPKAEHTVDMIEAPLVVLTQNQVLLDGNLTGTTDRIATTKQIGPVPGLYDALRAKRELWSKVHPNKECPGVVILQIDQDVPTLFVKSVFHTAASAGYPNISFMVSGAAPSGA